MSWSLAASIPMAMGRSKLGPSLRTSAGARLIVVRPIGNLKPELVRAVETRSRDSFTAASGSPTITTTVSPQPELTSTSTGNASIPLTAADKTRASIETHLGRTEEQGQSGFCRSNVKTLPIMVVSLFRRAKFRPHAIAPARVSAGFREPCDIQPMRHWRGLVGATFRRCCSGPRQSRDAPGQPIESAQALGSFGLPDAEGFQGRYEPKRNGDQGRAPCDRLQRLRVCDVPAPERSRDCTRARRTLD